MLVQRDDARALVVELVRHLNRVRSWSGATQIQKCTFFLRHLLGVPLPYDFVIYHYGPFSFELDEDLVLMRFRGWLDVEREEDYGVHYHPGPKAPGELPTSVEKFRDEVETVVSLFGKADVKRLELLATSYYLRQKLAEKGRSRGEIVAAVKRLKPHFEESQIFGALSELDRIERTRAATRRH